MEKKQSYAYEPLIVRGIKYLIKIIKPYFTKKVIITLCTIVILIPIFLFIFRYNFIYEYKIDKNDKSITIIKYKGDEQDELVIPNKILGYPVTILGDHSFKYSDFKKIYIPDTVIEIRSNAFLRCYSLKEVKGMKNVEIIMNDAFNYCNLYSFKVPPKVTSLDTRVFYDCINLSNIELHENITSIKLDALFNCQALEEITIPSSVTYMADELFGFHYDRYYDKPNLGIPLIKTTKSSYADTYAQKHEYDVKYID